MSYNELTQPELAVLLPELPASIGRVWHYGLTSNLT